MSDALDSIIGGPEPLEVAPPEQVEEESPRELAIKRREQDRLRTGVRDLRVNSDSAGPSLAVPN